MARGRLPLPDVVRRRILDSIAAGHSQVQTALRVGVHRRTVQNVIAEAAGRLPKHELGYRRLGKGEARLTEPEICPGCRSRILIVPCRLCGVRKYHEALRALLASGKKIEKAIPRRPRAPDSVQLKLELEPAEQQRLQEVRSGLFVDRAN